MFLLSSSYWVCINLIQIRSQVCLCSLRLCSMLPGVLPVYLTLGLSQSKNSASGHWRGYEGRIYASNLNFSVWFSRLTASARLALQLPPDSILPGQVHVLSPSARCPTQIPGLSLCGCLFLGQKWPFTSHLFTKVLLPLKDLFRPPTWSHKIFFWSLFL